MGNAGSVTRRKSRRQAALAYRALASRRDMTREIMADLRGAGFSDAAIYLNRAWLELCRQAEALVMAECEKEA